MKNYEQFINFIVERDKIRANRDAGFPAPWTEDPILRDYRFCNIRREDDRVTRWIHDNWLSQVHDNPGDAIGAMTVARQVNLIETLDELGPPMPWVPSRFVKVIQNRRKRGLPAYNAAYIIHCGSLKPGMSKADYIAYDVIDPIMRNRRTLGKALGNSLQALYDQLVTYTGMGSFMAGQTIADVKWSTLGVEAPDRDTFVAPGPGSQRGLGWLVDGKPRQWNHVDFILRLQELRTRVNNDTLFELDAQNVQNCLCEFSKYMKAKSGNGFPKQKFSPVGNRISRLPQILYK